MPSTTPGASHGHPELKAAPAPRLNIDLLAVAIALTLAALIRFNVLPNIKF